MIMTIALSNVRFHYPKQPQTPVLVIPDWSVSVGEQVFVHGKSGGGKSTLLNLISGLLHPQTGEVNVLNHPLHTMSNRQRDRFRAQHIGYVFQQFNLIPYLDAVDNIRLANQLAKPQRARATQDDIHTLLEQLNINAQTAHTPTQNLSIGQQQRIAIARALINQPQLLIADEPTSALDQANREAFMSLLMPLIEQHNTTLLFVSHDLSLASHFSRVDALDAINHIAECVAC